MPIAVIGAGIAATAAAEFSRVAWRDLRTVIVEPALLLLVLLSVARDRPAAQRLGVALVLGAVVSAAVALLLIPSGAVVTDAGPPRLRGLFGSPNNLALILERALPVAVGLALMAMPRPRIRAAAWAAVALLVAVLVLTFSRGAWIGALAGLAFALMPVWRRSAIRHSGGELAPSLLRGRNPGAVLRRMRAAAPLLVAGLVAAGLVAAIITTGGDRLAQLMRPSDAATAARPLLWDSAWRMLADNPILGVGPDNFLYHYRDYIRPEAWAEPNISHAHNIALDTWLTLGLPGLVLLAAVLAVYARTWRTGPASLLARRAKRSSTASAARCWRRSCTAWSIAASSSPSWPATFWVVIALTVILATSPRVIPSEARNLKPSSRGLEGDPELRGRSLSPGSE